MDSFGTYTCPLSIKVYLLKGYHPSDPSFSTFISESVVRINVFLTSKRSSFLPQGDAKGLTYERNVPKNGFTNRNVAETHLERGQHSG